MGQISKDERSRRFLKQLTDKFGGVYSFCDLCGISHGTIYNILTSKIISGKTKSLSLDHSRKIFNAMKLKGIRIKPADLNPDHEGILFE